MVRLAKKLHKGNFADIRQKRGWSEKFTSEQVSLLQQILGDKCSNDLITEIESYAAHYFQNASQTIVKTMAHERKRASEVENHSREILHLLSGSGSPEQLPADNFGSYLESHLGDWQGVNKLFRDIEKLYQLSHEYVKSHKKLPRKKPNDAWKVVFAGIVVDALRRQGVNIGKGRDTICYQVLHIAFQLLGEDAVQDPVDYTVL